MDCYIIFTRSQHGHHAHVIVTRDPSFKTPEERFDQLGPLSIEPELGDAEVGERIGAAMSHWIAQPENAEYLAKSANPVAVFHDARAEDPAIISSVPRHVVDSILDNTKVYAKAYTLDPLVAARWCQ
jgi:hypothetical protein